jgi:hypothetical protein
VPKNLPPSTRGVSTPAARTGRSDALGFLELEPQ